MEESSDIPPAGSGRAGPALDRRALVAAGDAAIAGRSPSLAFASRLLARRQREDLRLLYLWCRACTDLIAGADAVADLARIRAKTEAALSGAIVGEAPFDALAIVVRDCNQPHRYPRLFLDGLAMDVDDIRPRDEAGLFRYCHHIAGVPAAMAAITCGVKPDDGAALGHAADLGIACRLATIARDISVDAAADRCYLPDAWLSEMDIPPGEHMKPPYRPRLAVLAHRLADRVEGFLASASQGLAALPMRPSWAALTLAAIQREIVEDVVARGERGWDHRQMASGVDRIDKAMKAGFRALLRNHIPPDPDAEPLWRPERP
jgi:phytoene synthase